MAGGFSFKNNNPVTFESDRMDSAEKRENELDLYFCVSNSL